MASRAPQVILAFDDKCGPCSSFKAAVHLLDPDRTIRFVSIEAAEGSGLLASVKPALRYASFHLIRPARSATSAADVLSGSEALLPLTRLLSPGGRVASRMVEAVPGGAGAVAFAYSTLSRLHQSCSLRDERRGSGGSEAAGRTQVETRR